MNDYSFGAKPAVLRCSRCGTFVDWAEARAQVVCECRPRLELPPVLVREAADAERAGRRSNCFGAISAPAGSWRSAK